MSKLPKIGDFLYVKQGKTIVRHLKVIEIEDKSSINDSSITVLGKYGRKYK